MAAIGAAPQTPDLPTADPTGQAAAPSPITAGEDQPIEARLKYGTDLHSRILARLNARLDLAYKHAAKRFDAWDGVDEHLRLFVDYSRAAKRGDGSADGSKRENPFERAVVIPASLAVAEVRKTQMCSLLFFRDPFMQISGREPSDMKPGELMEALLQYDAEQTNYRLKMYSLVNDADRYGRGIVYDTWYRQMGMVAAQPNPLLQALGISQPKQWGVTKEYNDWDNIDPYNFLPDPRVTIARVQEGEFCGHTNFRGKLWLFERAIENGGVFFNLDHLTSNPGANPGKSAPTRTRARFAISDFALTGSPDEKDSGINAIDHLQIRIIPKDWELGDSTMPEIWWFAIANGDTIIRAHENPYDHGEFTYAVGEVAPDPHTISNPGMIENLAGLQRVIDWSFNSRRANIMKALNNAGLYLPSLVEEDDILNPGPGLNVRLSMEGERLVKAGLISPDAIFRQFQVSDVTGPHGELMNLAFDFMQRTSAANDPSQGAQTTEKRTLGEVQTMMTASSQRLAITMQMLDTMAISALARRAIANRQQFTSLTQFYRIVGDMARQDGQPVRAPIGANDIQGGFDYVGHSGAMPSDPARDAQTWLMIWQTIVSAPQIFLTPSPADGTIMDPRKVFNEVARRAGVRNIEQFYTQPPMMPPMGLGQLPPGFAPPTVLPDAQVQAGAASGQMVPLGGPQ
jgi:hypothetical protein